MTINAKRPPPPRRAPKPTVSGKPQGVLPIGDPVPSNAVVVSASAASVSSESSVSAEEMKLRGRAGELLAASNRAVIKDQDTAEKGVDLAKMIRTAKAKLEDERKTLVKPFNDGVKAINDRFKVFTNQLDQARAVIDGKILAFNREQAELRRKEAEASRVAVSPAAVVAEQQSMIPPPVAPPVSVGPTRGSMGTGSTITKYDAEVVDIGAVPHEFLMVDMVAVRKRINGEKRETAIPGLRIFTVESLGVR